MLGKAISLIDRHKVSLAVLSMVGGLAFLSKVADWEKEDLANLKPLAVEQLPQDFKSWMATWTPVSKASQMTPEVTFSGIESSILLQTAIKQKPKSFPLPLRLEQRVLARTKSGRYFELRYITTTADADDCRTYRRCGRFDELRVLDDAEAKTWVYYKREFSAEEFKRVFGEEMPAREVPA